MTSGCAFAPAGVVHLHSRHAEAYRKNQAACWNAFFVLEPFSFPIVQTPHFGVIDRSIDRSFDSMMVVFIALLVDVLECLTSLRTGCERNISSVSHKSLKKKTRQPSLMWTWVALTWKAFLDDRLLCCRAGAAVSRPQLWNPLRVHGVLEHNSGQELREAERAGVSVHLDPQQLAGLHGPVWRR